MAPERSGFDAEREGIAEAKANRRASIADDHTPMTDAAGARGAMTGLATHGEVPVCANARQIVVMRRHQHRCHAGQQRQPSGLDGLVYVDRVDVAGARLEVVERKDVRERR